MKIKTKLVLLALCLQLGLFLTGVCAAAPKAVYNLLIVDSQKGEPYHSVREEMLKELEKAGYLVGKNLKIQHYSIGNQEGATRSIWDKESKNSYDAIFVNGTVATVGFKKLALGDKKNSFVFGAITDPIGEGVIDAFDAPPKANFTGVCYPVKVVDRLRFIKQVMPSARKIGLIYADMPQSHSYRKWVEDALKLPEFKDLQVVFRTVPFVKSEEGHRRMAELAKKDVLDLNAQVDAFMSPNDQMGVQQPFPEMVFKNATKPLIALGKKEVTDDWGATMSIYPDQEGAGRMIAGMIKQLFEGKPTHAIPPRWPPVGYAFDMNKVKKFNLVIPPSLIEAAGRNGVKVIYVSPNKKISE